MTRLKLALFCGTAVSVALVLGGCAGARTPLDPGVSFEQVQTRIDQRTMHRVEWPREEQAREQIRDEVSRILSEEPFTVETAVQIALLNNPGLRAKFEDIGIAHAAVVQAGIMSNPRMSFTAKFPDASPHRPKLEFPFVQNVVELYLIPMRRRVAKDMLMQAMLRTSDSVLSLGQEVRETYFGLAASRRLLTLEEEALGRATETVRRARHLAEQGHVAELELRRAEAGEQAQRLRVGLAQMEIETQRETLRKLLGLTATQMMWPQEPELPPLPHDEPDLAILEIRGLERRLDVELARQNVQLVDHAESLTRRSLFPSVNLGITVERDRDKTLLIGPKLALELPLFDQQQGTKIRLAAQARQSRELYESQVDAAIAEIRTARAQFVGGRRMAEFYENIILPMRGEVMAATRKQELGQLLSMDDLLLAADEELLSQLAAVRALRDYWISRSRLERAAACDLGQLPPSGAALAWLRWAPAELAGPPGHAGGMISIDGSGPEAEEGLAAREAELLMARPDRD